MPVRKPEKKITPTETETAIANHSVFKINLSEKINDKMLQKSYRIKESEFLNFIEFINYYSLSESQAVRFAIKFFMDNFNLEKDKKNGS